MPKIYTWEGKNGKKKPTKWQAPPVFPVMMFETIISELDNKVNDDFGISAIHQK